MLSPIDQEDRISKNPLSWLTVQYHIWLPRKSRIEKEMSTAGSQQDTTMNRFRRPMSNLLVG